MVHTASQPSCVGISGSGEKIVVIVTEDGKRTDTAFSTLTEATEFAAEERERLKTKRSSK